jgi:hypothetical protein
MCSWFHEFINTLLTRWFSNRNIEQLIPCAGARDIVQKNPDHLVALECPHSYLKGLKYLEVSGDRLRAYCLHNAKNTGFLCLKYSFYPIYEWLKRCHSA